MKVVDATNGPRKTRAKATVASGMERNITAIQQALIKGNVADANNGPRKACALPTRNVNGTVKETSAWNGSKSLPAEVAVRRVRSFDVVVRNLFLAHPRFLSLSVHFTHFTIYSACFFQMYAGHLAFLLYKYTS